MNRSVLFKVIVIVFVAGGLLTGVANPFNDKPLIQLEKTEFEVMGVSYDASGQNTSTRLQRLRMFTNQSSIFAAFVCIYLLAADRKIRKEIL